MKSDRAASKNFKNARHSGAVMVETALLLPLFLIFWFGIVDWGLTFYVHESIVYRANTAVRWAVVNDFSEEKIQNMVLYGTPGSGTGSGLFGLQRDMIHARQLGLDSSGQPTKDHRVEVEVRGYEWVHFTPFFASKYTGRPIRVSLYAEDMKTD